MDLRQSEWTWICPEVLLPCLASFLSGRDSQGGTSSCTHSTRLTHLVISLPSPPRADVRVNKTSSAPSACAAPPSVTPVTSAFAVSDGMAVVEDGDRTSLGLLLSPERIAELQQQQWAQQQQYGVAATTEEPSGAIP